MHKHIATLVAMQRRPNAWQTVRWWLYGSKDRRRWVDVVQVIERRSAE